MFCQFCGKQLEDTAQFCSACGNRLSANAPTPPPEPAAEKMKTHLQALVVFWAIYSVFHILTGVWTLAFSRYLVPMISNFLPRDANLNLNVLPITQFLYAIYGAVFVYALIVGVAGLITAWGLWQRKSWARVLALVMGIISVINIPFGTAVGVYTLIVLMPSEAGDAYRRLAVPA